MGLFVGFYVLGASDALIYRGDRGGSTDTSSIESWQDSEQYSCPDCTYDRASSFVRVGLQGLSNRYFPYRDFASLTLYVSFVYLS